MKIKVGNKAPDFSLPDEHKEMHSPSDYLGNWLLIYFYPKDDTPGCTVEAKEIRDAYNKFKRANIAVLGISKDTANSHKRFIEKYDLPFALLSDKEKEIADLYGSLGLKKFMGREYMGVLRNSYLISPEGKIKKIYEDVTPQTHATEVLDDVKSFS